LRVTGDHEHVVLDLVVDDGRGLAQLLERVHLLQIAVGALQLGEGSVPFLEQLQEPLREDEAGHDAEGHGPEGVEADAHGPVQEHVEGEVEHAAAEQENEAGQVQNQDAFLPGRGPGELAQDDEVGREHAKGHVGQEEEVVERSGRELAVPQGYHAIGEKANAEREGEAAEDADVIDVDGPGELGHVPEVEQGEGAAHDIHHPVPVQQRPGLIQTRDDPEIDSGHGAEQQQCDAEVAEAFVELGA
jgi:hypothetical protein